MSKAMGKKEVGKKQKNKPGLKRRLGVFSVFSICTGAAFSSGFFLLPGIATGTTGPLIPLVYLAAGILMLPAILSMSELSAAMPRSGGPYFFVTRSFGALLGMIGALGKFIQLILKGAFAFVGVGIYLSVLVEVPVQLVAVVLIVLFTLLNLLGVRQTATTEKILVVILLVILSYFVVAGVSELFSSNRNLEQEFQPLLPYGWEGIFSGIALVFISFGGVAQVASVAEEVKSPASSFPKGMLLSLAVSIFFYLAGTALMVTLLSPDALRGDQTPVVTAAEQFQNLPLPAIVVVIAALAAFASTGNAAILSASRYPLALARDSLLWAKFGKLSKKGVPNYSVILAGTLSIILVLLLNVKEIAKTASAFLLFVFLFMCLALIIFRESKKENYQPKYKSPLYPWTQIIGSLIYIWLIWESGWEAMAFIAAMFVLGIFWYTFGLKHKPKLSAAIFYLFGRLAHKGSRSQIQEGANLSAGRENLTSVIENSIIIDLEEENSFDDAVEKAAGALRDRLGGKKENITGSLKEEVQHWKNPEKFNISVAPVLLQGIEQPEMVILRGKIALEDRHLQGLIVLVDDENSSNRLLQLLSQLEVSLSHHDFPSAWEKAENATELQQSLVQDIRSFSVWIKDSGPTSQIKEKKIKDIQLPKNSLIGAMYREGKIVIPGPEEIVKEGDELIIIAQGKALEALSERFSEKAEETKE